MTTNIERTAAAIREAFNAMSPSITLNGAETVIAQALADAGLLMPDLPEPDMRRVSGTSFWCEGDLYAHRGSRKVRLQVEDSRMSSDEARAIAFGLLAAADHAEQEQGND